MKHVRGTFATMLSLCLFLLLLCAYCVHTCPTSCDCSPIKSRDGEETKMMCNSKNILSISQLNPDSWDTSITFLDLSENQITRIPAGVISRLTNLQRLNLSGNAISELEPRVFSTNRHLERLDLSHNSIARLDKSMFTGLDTLERLYIQGNRLTSLAEDAFEPLIALKRLELGWPGLLCDCTLSWLADWLTRIGVRIGDSAVCAAPQQLQGSLFRQLRPEDLLCDLRTEIPDFKLTPNKSQIVFQNDKLQLKCQATPLNDRMTLVWMREGREVTASSDKGTLIHTDTLPDGMMQTILVIENLQSSDDGLWQCHVHAEGSHVTPLGVTVVVMKNSSLYCPEMPTPTNKGVLVWPTTSVGTVSSQKCPHGPAVNFSGPGPALATHECSRQGVWRSLDVSRCQYESHTTAMLHQYAQMHFRNVSLQGLLESERQIEALVSDPSLIQDRDDVIYLAAIIERFLDEAEPTSLLSVLVVDTISMMADVAPSVLDAAQRSHRVLTRMLQALETIATKMLSFRPSVAMFSRNIAMYAVRVTSQNFAGLTCTAYDSTVDAAELAGAVDSSTNTQTRDDRRYQEDNFMCLPPAEQNAQSASSRNGATSTTSPLSRLQRQISASITLPPSLVTELKCLPTTVSCKRENGGVSAILQVILFRQATLFPVENKNPKKNKKRAVTSPVITANIVGAVAVNLSQPVTVQLRSESADSLQQVAAWGPPATEQDPYGAWQATQCFTSASAELLFTGECRNLVPYLALMQIAGAGAGSDGALDWLRWLRGAFTMSPFVYAGSFVLCTCALATLLSYMFCHRTLLMPRKLKHAISNLCLGVLLLCLTFTFGIYTRDPSALCHLIGMALHYFSVSVLLWLGVATYVMYRKYEKAYCPVPVVSAVEGDGAGATPTGKPVLGLYLIGWGLALILCGIVAAINSLQYYHNERYCFLTPSAQIFAFYVPVLGLFIVNLVLFFCVCCTISPSAHALVQDDTHAALRTPRQHTPQQLSTAEEPLARDADFDLLATAADSDMLDVNDVTEGSSVFAVAAQTSATEPITLANQNEALLTPAHKSLARSEPDIQYKPTSQLIGLVALLFLFLVTWSCAALSVALPLQGIYHQDIIFNCLYLFASSAIGVFMLVFFVFGREDGRISWHNACCCVKEYIYEEQYTVGPSTTQEYNALLQDESRVLSRPVRVQNGRVGHSGSSMEGSNCTSHRTGNSHKHTYSNYTHVLSNVPAVNSNPPTVTSSTFTQVTQDYPIFYNHKQNGIARKYWRKQRHRQNAYQHNMDYYKRHLGYDSDLNESASQRQAEIQLQPRSYLKHEPSTRPPLELYTQIPYISRDETMHSPIMPKERYQLAPIVGLSTVPPPPPASTLLPPDGGSCVTDSRASPIPSYDSYPQLPPPPHLLERQVNCYLSHSPISRPNGVGMSNLQGVYYAPQNGAIPRPRDFDGKSSTSRDTRAMSIGSDSLAPSYSTHTTSNIAKMFAPKLPPIQKQPIQKHHTAIDYSTARYFMENGQSPDIITSSLKGATEMQTFSPALVGSGGGTYNQPLMVSTQFSPSSGIPGSPRITVTNHRRERVGISRGNSVEKTDKVYQDKPRRTSLSPHGNKNSNNSCGRNVSSRLDIDDNLTMQSVLDRAGSHSASTNLVQDNSHILSHGIFSDSNLNSNSNSASLDSLTAEFANSYKSNFESGLVT